MSARPSSWCVAVLLAASLAGCGAHQQQANGSSGAQSAAVQAAIAPSDPNNLLIGKWRMSGFTPNPNIPGAVCDDTELVFTPTQQTLVSKGGAAATNSVTYNASSTVIYVMGNLGIAAYSIYKVIDQNHVQLDSIVPCNYERVG
jgi:hypothetical protein